MALVPMKFKEDEPIKIVTGTCAYSVAANSATTIDPLNSSYVTIPTGYTALGIVGFNTNKVDVLPVNIGIYNGAYSVFLRNISAATVNGTFTYDLFCIKNAVK